MTNEFIFCVIGIIVGFNLGWWVVWNAYILGNIKALISTTMHDGMYYEITYNRSKNEIYFDAYKKFENRLVEV